MTQYFLSSDYHREGGRWCSREFQVTALVAARQQEPIPTDRRLSRKTDGAYHNTDRHPCKSGAVPWISVLLIYAKKQSPVW